MTSENPLNSIVEITKSITDLIKPFTDPVLTEAGQYIADKIRFLRYKNSVNILIKAKQILDDQNLTPNPVDLKILVPIMESAGLESDNELIEKWANLLATASITNDVSPRFPKVLSELTGLDVHVLDYILNNERISNKTSYSFDDNEHVTTYDILKEFGDLNAIYPDNNKNKLLYISLDTLDQLGLIYKIQPKAGEIDHDFFEMSYAYAIKITFSIFGREFVQACTNPSNNLNKKATQ